MLPPGVITNILSLRHFLARSPMNNVFYIGDNPVIGKIGPIFVSWYILMISLAFITCIAWLIWQNRRHRILDSRGLLTVILLVVIFGIVFAKLAHVIDFFSYYTQHPGEIISNQGWAIWGAVLGAGASIWIYSKVSHKFRFTQLVDILAPGIILAQAVGRVGCTLNGCCYGIESNSPLAVIYTNPNTFAPVGIPVLPTQIFELLFCLAVFGLLLKLRGKLQPEGSLFLVYLALYAAWRVGIDFLRTGTPFLFGLHEAQVISLAVLLVTIPLITIRTRFTVNRVVAEA